MQEPSAATGKSVCANPFFYCAINKFHKPIRFIIKTSSTAILKMSPAGWQQPGGGLIHQTRFVSRTALICKEYLTMAKAKTIRTTPTPTPNSNVTSISSASAAPESKRKQAVVDVEGEIRQRAYQLYEQRGFVSGHENEDWLTAEREILARSHGQQSA
jgi:hypothetical protein